MRDVEETGGSAAGRGESNLGHLVSGKAFDSAADVDLEHRVVALQKQAFQLGFTILRIDHRHLHGKAAERLEVTIAVQDLPDAGTADFQNIRLRQDIAGFNRLSKEGTEPGAVVKADVITVAVANLNLERHRIQMREQLNRAEVETVGNGNTRAEALEIGKKWMRQDKVWSGIGPTGNSVVTCLPWEMPVGHPINVEDRLTTPRGQSSGRRGRHRRPVVLLAGMGPD